jgi:predicted DNA-binding ribbon-helix-helix protein
MSRPRKRSFNIKGHRTSVSLEEPFWAALRDVAAKRGVALAALVEDIDRARGGMGLSSAIRVHLLGYYRDQG